MSHTRYPIKDDVMMYCEKCHAYVWCERSVYPDEVLYTCKQRKHHFRHLPESRIQGDKQVPAPKDDPCDDDDR